MKLENQILDIYDDVCLEGSIQKIAQVMPGGRRDAEFPTLEERDEKPDSAFALSVLTKSASKLNKYLVDSPVSTYLSNEYFARNYSKLPWEAQKIAATTVGDAMTPDPVSVAPDTGIETLAALMVDSNFHTLPVVEDGKLVGVVGKEDVLRTLLNNSHGQ